jgi:single-strand DNA-binding protein
MHREQIEKHQHPLPMITNTSNKNKVQLIGNIGREPELKDLQNGQHMLRFSLATNERFKGADGEWKSDTQWHAVVAWGKQASKLSREIAKGSGLFVEGRLVHRKYESKTGEMRYSTEVVMSDYQVLAKPAPTEQE